MPRPKSKIPSVTLHKRSGQARVRLDGRDFYLGPFGSEQADERYRRVVAEFIANGAKPKPDVAAGLPDAGISIAELVLAYWRFADAYYVKDDQPTSEVWLVKDTLKMLREHYGMTPAAEFGPLKLKALREVMIAKGWCRSAINSRVGRVKRMFRWATENEYVPANVHHALLAVAGLRQGRTEAKESEPVRPVDESTINATLPKLSRQVRSMVKLQCLTGCRPGEVVSMRPCDVNRDGEIWEFRPSSHKTQHHGRERTVYIGPKAQSVLLPWLDNRPAESFCFSPAEAELERLANMRAARKTRVQPSQRDRSKAKPKRKPRERYTVGTYAASIAKACRKAEVDCWSPNRLRHSRATSIRRMFGLEAAQVTLGHSNAQVTQVYAERDAELARKVALEIG